MPADNTMRMTDTAIEETSVAGSTQSSVTEMVTSETPVVQGTEMNSAETSEISEEEEEEEEEDTTEIFELISENAPIK